MMQIGRFSLRRPDHGQLYWPSGCPGHCAALFRQVCGDLGIGCTLRMMILLRYSQDSASPGFAQLLVKLATRVVLPANLFAENFRTCRLLLSLRT